MTGNPTKDPNCINFSTCQIEKLMQFAELPEKAMVRWTSS